MSVMSLISLALLARAAEETTVEAAAEASNHVQETKVPGFEYVPGVFNNDIAIQNVFMRPKELYLRMGVETSAMLRWEPPNPVSNWAVRIDFNELNLEADEAAGLYLRYTTEKAHIGPFKGGNDTFHGFMAGIEFHGRSASLVFVDNDGRELANAGDAVVRIDSINPARLRGHASLSLHVISTDKNLALELYDGDTLLYDGFRISAADKANGFRAGQHLGIIANYRNVASTKAFVLRGAQLFARTEDAAYRPYARRSATLPTGTVRERDEIPHPNADIRELIHNGELVTRYVRRIIGEFPETNFLRTQHDLERELDITARHTQRLLALKQEKPLPSSADTQANSYAVQVQQLRRSIQDLARALDILTEDTHSLPFGRYLLLMAGSAIFGALCYREYARAHCAAAKYA